MHASDGIGGERYQEGSNGGVSKRTKSAPVSVRYEGTQQRGKVCGTEEDVGQICGRYLLHPELLHQKHRKVRQQPN